MRARFKLLASLFFALTLAACGGGGGDGDEGAGLPSGGPIGPGSERPRLQTTNPQLGATVADLSTITFSFIDPIAPAGRQ